MTSADHVPRYATPDTAEYSCAQGGSGLTRQCQHPVRFPVSALIGCLNAAGARARARAIRVLITVIGQNTAAATLRDAAPNRNVRAMLTSGVSGASRRRARSSASAWLRQPK